MSQANREAIVKLLRTIAGSPPAIISGHDVTISAAADLIERQWAAIVGLRSDGICDAIRILGSRYALANPRDPDEEIELPSYIAALVHGAKKISEGGCDSTVFEIRALLTEQELKELQDYLYTGVGGMDVMNRASDKLHAALNRTGSKG